MEIDSNGDYIMESTMTQTKISNSTLDVLKNFSSINSNILVKEGNVLTTISPVKNVMAEATVPESFDQEFGIWDLNKFLGTISLFEDPEYMFEEKYVTISSGKNNSSVRYYYSEPSLLTTVNKQINMPEAVVTCSITQNVFNDILKASSVLQVSDIAIRSNSDELEIVALDKKDKSSNSYSIALDHLPAGAPQFSFFFKSENLKMLSGDYDVSISDKVVSQFTNTNRSLKYWVALESDSYFNHIQ
tara:strand:+ start:2488 stop:3222 length:735 start_codon:yes stop_codon:yes gene_type:complete